MKKLKMMFLKNFVKMFSLLTAVMKLVYGLFPKMK